MKSQEEMRAYKRLKMREYRLRNKALQKREFVKRDNRIKELYQKGYKISHIAKITGLTFYKVRSVIEDN